MRAVFVLALFVPLCGCVPIKRRAAASHDDSPTLAISKADQAGHSPSVKNENQTSWSKDMHLATADGKKTSHAVMLPLALGIVADQCKCRFTGLCTCGAAVQFMDCINDACASGTCDCKQAEFLNSCSSMAATCPNVGLSCTAERSTCSHAPVPINMNNSEIVGELHAMKVRKCNLKAAADVGYVNAGIRLRALLPKIQGHLDMLRMSGGKKAVYMGCAPPPKGEEGKDWIASWEAGEALLLPSRTPALLSMHQKGGVEPVVAAQPEDTPKPDTGRRGVMFASILCHVVFILLVAFVYDRFRMKMVYKKPEASGAEASWLDCGSSDPNSFKFGLFGCFGDWKICCLAFWCFQVRWADTMDKANGHDGAEAGEGETGTPETTQPKKEVEGTISYGHGVLLLLALWLLGQMVGVAGFNVYFGTVVFLATLYILVRYRQKLRMRYNLSAGSWKTYMEDVMAYLCCPCCAAVQEARHVEATNSADKCTDAINQEQP